MEVIKCHEEMEPAPRAGDPDQGKDKAVADKETRAEEPVAKRAGAKVKDHKEGRAKARVVEDDKAVNKSFGIIY